MKFLRAIAFGVVVGCGAGLVAQQAHPAVLGENDVIATIQLAENEAPLRFTLKQMMEALKIPGLSVALINDDKIAWAKGYGVTEAGGTRPVTPRTLFQAGSISKPVAATGTMWLVEQGKLSLDEDVNLKLKTWKVPDNEFTKTEKVTLRRLVSHSAGMTVHGFPGYAVGEPVPMLVQVLNGEKPANTDPIRVDTVPGTKLRYSGGGVTVEQLLVQDVTGEPFPEFMRKTVLSKTGMNDSTYEQPIPADRADMTATGTRADGKSVDGRWHVYPEMAAAGLWTTPTDLAKFAIETALSKHGKANHVLSQKMTQEMLKPQAKGQPGEIVGLAFFLGDEKHPDQFGHSGADEGFQADLAMFADSGKGWAIMGNTDALFGLAGYVEDALAKEVGLSLGRGHNVGGELMLLLNVKGKDAAMQRYRYVKQHPQPGYKVDDGTLNGFGYMLLQGGKVQDAIETFKLNVADNPQCSNCYDSLGEAYMNAGQKQLAIENYEKSIALDPKNENGVKMLKKLREQ